MNSHAVCVAFFTRWFWDYNSITDKDYADFNAAITNKE